MLPAVSAVLSLNRGCCCLQSLLYDFEWISISRSVEKFPEWKSNNADKEPQDKILSRSS